MKLPVRLQQLLALQAKIGRCHPTDRHSLAGCFESSRMNLGVLSGLLPGRIITNEKYHRVIMKRGGWYGNTRNKLLIWNLPWERKFIISVWDGALGSSGSTRAYRTVRVSLFFFWSYQGDGMRRRSGHLGLHEPPLLQCRRATCSRQRG